MKRLLFNNWFEAQNYIAKNRKYYEPNDTITIGEKTYQVVGTNNYGELILQNGKEREVI